MLIILGHTVFIYFLNLLNCFSWEINSFAFIATPIFNKIVLLSYIHYSLPCNKFVQKVITQVKKLVVTAFKVLYMYKIKKAIVIPRAAHQALARAFTWALRFTSPLCNYCRSPSMWDLQFSSASQLGASTRWVLNSKFLA